MIGARAAARVTGVPRIGPAWCPVRGAALVTPVRGRFAGPMKIDVTESVALLTWSIVVERSRTVLTGTLNMDLPVETILASFSPVTALALPIVQPLVARSVRKRLRQRLLAMADGSR